MQPPQTGSPRPDSSSSTPTSNTGARAALKAEGEQAREWQRASRDCPTDSRLDSTAVALETPEDERSEAQQILVEVHEKYARRQEVVAQDLDDAKRRIAAGENWAQVVRLVHRGAINQYGISAPRVIDQFHRELGPLTPKQRAEAVSILRHELRQQECRLQARIDQYLARRADTHSKGKTGHAPRRASGTHQRGSRRAAASSPTSSSDPGDPDEPGEHPALQHASALEGYSFADLCSFLNDTFDCPVCDEPVLARDPQTGRKRRDDALTCPKPSCAKKYQRDRDKLESEYKARAQRDNGDGWVPPGCDCDCGGGTYLEEDSATGDLDLICLSCGRRAALNGRCNPVEPDPKWILIFRRAVQTSANGGTVSSGTLRYVNSLRTSHLVRFERRPRDDGYGRLLGHMRQALTVRTVQWDRFDFPPHSRQEDKKAVPSATKKRDSKELRAPIPIAESSSSDAEPSDADLNAIDAEEAPDLDVAV